MHIKKISFALLTALLVSGCGTTRTTVLEPVAVREKIQTITLKPSANTVTVDPEHIKTFESVIRERLYEELKFREGTDLTISYRFVQCDEGNRFARYMSIGIGSVGEGSVTVEFRFIDQNGKEIGKIQTGGTISAGFLGGGFDSAVEKAADALTEYIQMNIHNG